MGEFRKFKKMKLFHFLALAALTEANPSIANPCGFAKCLDENGKKCKLAVADPEDPEKSVIHKACGTPFPPEENPGCFTECKRRVEEFDKKAEKKREKKRAA